MFDVNTVGELHRLGEELPWVYDFEGGTAIIDVTFALDPDRISVSPTGTSASSSRWPAPATSSTTSGSASWPLPLERVRDLVADRFELLEEVDEDGLPATDTSVKAYYALRRRD